MRGPFHPAQMVLLFLWIGVMGLVFVVSLFFLVALLVGWGGS